jgi:hypothetical protein
LDIPSSNFISDKGKKTNKYAIKFEDYMTSIPTTKLKHQDPSKILHSMPLPEKYRDVMGPDPSKLESYDKEKLRKANAQRKLLKDKMEERESSLQKRKGEEDKEISMLPTEIYQDEQGRIRDKSGKIITIAVSPSPHAEHHRQLLGYKPSQVQRGQNQTASQVPEGLGARRRQVEQALRRHPQVHQ